MKKPENLKALLIDMDGTLANSIPLLYRAYVAFMKNFDLIGTEHEFEELIGPSLNDIITVLKEKHNLPGTFNFLKDIYHKELELFYASPIPLFPESRKSLEYAGKNHLQCILVTSASGQLARNFLQAQKLEHAFKHIVTGDLAHRGKPDPELYLLALDKIQIKPSEAIAIEDSLAGVRSAQAAHIPTFWIFGKTSEEDYNHLSSVTTVNGWKEILTLLRSWYE